MRLSQVTLYHSFLRVALVVSALVLIFDSGLVVPMTKELSTNAGWHLASVVGVKVGVAPNEVNQLTGRITELETELAEKERLIAVNVQEKQNTESFDMSTFILSIIVIILLVLVVLNYILDYLRIKKGLIRTT